MMISRGDMLDFICACLAFKITADFGKQQALTPTYTWSQSESAITVLLGVKYLQYTPRFKYVRVYSLNQQDLNLHSGSLGHFNISGTGGGEDNDVPASTVEAGKTAF